MHCTDILPLVLALPDEGLEVSPTQTTAPVIAVAPRELATLEFSIENIPSATITLIQENRVDFSVDMWFGGCSGENTSLTFTKIAYGDKPVPAIKDCISSVGSASDSSEAVVGICKGSMIFRDVWRAPSDADGIPKTLAPLRVRVVANAKNSTAPLFITNLSHGFIMRGKRMHASRKYISATVYPPPSLTPIMRAILTADFERHSEVSDSLAASIATRMQSSEARLDSPISSVITALSNSVSRVAYEAKKARSMAPDGTNTQAVTATTTLHTLLDTMDKLDQPDPAMDSDDYDIGSANTQKGMKDATLASMLLDLRGTGASTTAVTTRKVTAPPLVSAGAKRPRGAISTASTAVNPVPFVHPAVFPDFYPMAMVPAAFPSAVMPDAFRSFVPVVYPEMYQQYVSSQPTQPSMSAAHTVMLPQHFVPSAAIAGAAMPTYSSFLRAMQG